MMMDAYSFDVSEEASVRSYENIRNAYFNIFNRLGLEVIPVIADNGSIGGKKSEEFMVLTESGEDRILVDKESGRAFNIEILEKENWTFEFCGIGWLLTGEMPKTSKYIFIAVSTVSYIPIAS